MALRLQLRLVSQTLSHGKPERIVFSSKPNAKETENLHIKIGSGYIKASAIARDLGFIPASVLGMAK